jgi:hypothetical protein
LNFDRHMREVRVEILDSARFAAAFGVPAERLPAQCETIIDREDFSYEVLLGEERDRVILDVLKRLESDTQKVGAPERRDVWERGWREALTEYVHGNFSPIKLVPKFIRKNQIARVNKQYVRPANPNFELRCVEVLREWMFREFFSDVDEVHEFGCGTGFNLVSLAKVFPDKRLFGSDFVPASIELVNETAKHLDLRLSARLFDMISPPDDYAMAPGSGIFTFGALEQLASQFERFLRFLIDRHPGICVHVEPTVELYDENNVVDYLAIRFHRKRGYTEGLLPRLQKLAADRQIELLRVVRTNFGSLMMEGYNLLIWRPLN